jgi:hypothetical protein
VALVEEVLVPHRLERPPHGLDVRGVHRPVGVVEVDPERDALRQPVPVLEELHDRLAALGVELRDAVALDVVLGLEPELLLHGDLDGQPVAVPAALALDVAAAHGLVAREDVLEHAREHVMGAGPAVRRRRALVEDPRLRALAAAQRLAEDVALAPALEHLLLEAGKADVLGDGTVRRHASRSRRDGRGRDRSSSWDMGKVIFGSARSSAAASSASGSSPTSTATRRRSRWTTCSRRTSRARSSRPRAAARRSRPRHRDELRLGSRAHRRAGRAQGKAIDDALGYPFRGDMNYTAESKELFIFERAGQVRKFADYRGQGSFEGFERPVAERSADAAVLSVRDLVIRPG